MSSSFGVVIVNYNCAPLAIDAALSALGAAKGVRVVIIDNASTDDSRLFFSVLLEGTRPRRPEAPAAAPRPVRFADLVSTTTAIVREGEAAPGGDLAILLARENKGYAAGCNLGLKLLSERGRPDLFLLLNPDALVAAGAFEAFAARLSAPDAGPCGASVLSFDAPHLAQAFGGAALDPLTLAGRNIGAGLSLDDAPSTDEAEPRLSYPLGAALAFRADYLDSAGFLDERYFLYYEEADFTRAGRRRPLWARDAVVYHRYGASSQSRSGAERSPLADYHMARSRFLFALKWRPWIAPVLPILGAFQALRRFASGRLAAARAVALGSLPGAARRFRSV